MISSKSLALGACAFGRAIDAYGLPLDDGPLLGGRSVPLELRPPRPNDRVPILTPLWTGIRVVDGLLTIGRGARVGIFGAPGAGKTTLIESIVVGCAADAIVVALVGERGREAQRWVERCDERTTVVCATSDRPPYERVTAAHVAVVHAAALRERGLHVLLVLDSFARFAAASREIATAAGESVGRGGYPPSVFAQMARLVEVAGALERGSITLIATVISDGDDRDPVSEAARSVLDGHIALSTRLAEAGRFPAVDVPASASRTMEAVADRSHVRAARWVRRALALLDRIDDARALGIEPAERGARTAIAAEHRLEAFLRQGPAVSPYGATFSELMQLANCLEGDDGDT
jgi:ATP synthase in type III secretion protein N